MSHSARPRPWLRSVEASIPRNRSPDRRRLSMPEALAIVVVIAAVIAMVVWFVFLSSGGIGFGSL